MVQGVLLSCALVVLGLVIGHKGNRMWAGDAIGGWLLFAVLPWALGLLAARHAAMTRELAVNMVQLEGEQELRARRAAVDERNRVARELDDVIGHCVSVMVIQASAARLVAADDVAAARTALQTVGASWREAMTDLRRVMGVLRRGDDDIAGLAQLSTLIERAIAAGVPARLSVRGPAAAAARRAGPCRLPRDTGGSEQCRQARGTGPGGRGGMFSGRDDRAEHQRYREGIRAAGRWFPGLRPRPGRHARAPRPL